jgi:hypothetical protein
MPRRSKGARLQLKAARRDESGKITHRATWVIRDNGRDVSTGCAADEIAAAEEKLRDYIAAKYAPKRRVRHIDDIPIADVLSIYLDAQLDKLRSRFNVDSESDETVPAIRKFKRRIERLNEWWGAKVLGEVNGEACRSYTRRRRKKGGARRDLEDLRAAIGHHAAEGYHREIVKVSLPEKGEPRDKWLTRSDAAKLIGICWRYREMQKKSRRPMEDVKVPTAKRPLRLLARFILLGIYSGTGAGAIAAASPIPALGRSYVDLERGRYYRRKVASIEGVNAQAAARHAEQWSGYIAAVKQQFPLSPEQETEIRGGVVDSRVREMGRDESELVGTEHFPKGLGTAEVPVAGQKSMVSTETANKWIEGVYADEFIFGDRSQSEARSACDRRRTKAGSKVRNIALS